MKVINSGTYVLEGSGREFDANCLIIGISPDLEIFDGYDGSIPGLNDYGTDYYDGTDLKRWDANERRELAEFMIDLWTRFKNQES